MSFLSCVASLRALWDVNLFFGPSIYGLHEITPRSFLEGILWIRWEWIIQQWTSSPTRGRRVDCCRPSFTVMRRTRLIRSCPLPVCTFYLSAETPRFFRTSVSLLDVRNQKKTKQSVEIFELMCKNHTLSLCLLLRLFHLLPGRNVESAEKEMISWQPARSSKKLTVTGNFVTAAAAQQVWDSCKCSESFCILHNMVQTVCLPPTSAQPPHSGSLDYKRAVTSSAATDKSA